VGTIGISLLKACFKLSATLPGIFIEKDHS
jgi:hypothetical protein